MGMRGLSRLARRFALASALLSLMGGMPFGGQVHAAGAADAYVAAAVATAGSDFSGILSLCEPGPPFARPNPLSHSAAPAKVFDNLYFVGLASVSAWALTTSRGIILIDALNTPEEAETYIEGGLRKLKLDPSAIEYVVVTHAHGDHYGGARYLAGKYGATLVMSNREWEMLGQERTGTRNGNGSVPRRIRGVDEGDTLTLGDTTIDFAITPPHTPGTLSLILPLKDGEVRHVGSLWGGTAFNFPGTEENFNAYAESARRFTRIARDHDADVPLSNHPVYDDALAKIAALKTRAAGGPHPFVLGTGSTETYLAVAAECAMAARERLRAANR
jgi:metallo-beta-lactamase class B